MQIDKWPVGKYGLIQNFITKSKINDINENKPKYRFTLNFYEHTVRMNLSTEVKKNLVYN